MLMNMSNSPQSLLQQMAQIQQMERGKLCVLRQGPDGPYYNHQTWEQGKNVSRYVPRDQLPVLREAIEGYERFQALSQQYVELMVEKTRAERALKKKARPRQTTRPRSMKSRN
jgi:hypothetical protein